jgi:uncharacterized protein YabN with tetrapyrrole methylase and pyrophosphatase domain
VTAPTETEFVIKADGQVIHRPDALTWQPQRHWEVHMVPMSHHDLGYTATIEEVLKAWDGYYDDILGFCEQTDGFPDDAFNELPYARRVADHFHANHHEHMVAPNTLEVLEKLNEELREFRKALDDNDRGEIEDELGDILFVLVNISRFVRVNPEDALRNAKRFLDAGAHGVKIERKQRRR